MAKNIKLIKSELLSRLKKIEYKPEEESDKSFLEQMSMARSILNLANINPEREYLLCRAVAEKLLDKIPEMEEFDLEL